MVFFEVWISSDRQETSKETNLAVLTADLNQHFLRLGTPGQRYSVSKYVLIMTFCDIQLAALFPQKSLFCTSDRTNA